MDISILEEVKGKSREERKSFFEEHKSEILDSMLENVNGGVEVHAYPGENPNSSCPYELCWWSSRGFICNGEVICK